MLKIDNSLLNLHGQNTCRVKPCVSKEKIKQNKNKKSKKKTYSMMQSQNRKKRKQGKR